MLFLLLIFIFNDLLSSQCLDYKYEYIYDYKTSFHATRSVKLIIYAYEDCNVRVVNPQLKIDETLFIGKNKTYEKVYLHFPYISNYEFVPLDPE